MRSTPPAHARWRVVTAMPAGRGRRDTIAGSLPVDLVIVVAFALFVDVLVLGSLGWAPFRFVLGAIFLLVLPGYAVLSALYPGRPKASAEDGNATPQLFEAHEGLLFGERIALSFGTSLALIPITAVTLGGLGIPLTPTTIVASLTLLVVGFVAVGAIRRAKLAPERRYVPLGQQATRGDGGRTRGGEYRGPTLLAAGLVLAVVLAGGAFAYGISADAPPVEYTSASLLTSNSAGEYTASGYPTNASVGESTELTLRVDNRHQETINVTAVGFIERAGGPGAGSVERDRLVTLEWQLAPNERWNATHEVEPTFAGENLRLAYYLYDGDVPDAVNAQTADRVLYLRIDVDDV